MSRIVRTTFKGIFCDEKVKKVVIPMIQRDYAQGRDDSRTSRIRKEFLCTLKEAVENEDKYVNLDFVYGVENDGLMKPIDGQQRLTTLFLLHWYASRKEKIAESECSFLSSFSYETRQSSRDFCRELLTFNPAFNGESLSYEIADQSWFPHEWEKDPTVRSMLVMLDAINEEFRDVGNIWTSLVDKNKVTFSFLPIDEDLGNPDDLYISMNSRGRQLTEFEKFKAVFIQTLEDNKEVAAEIVDDIARSFDTEWTDWLWKCRGKNEYVIDDMAMRYINFVFDVISYKLYSGKDDDKNEDIFQKIKDFFSGNAEKDNEALKIFRDFFDCWTNVSNPISFVADFTSSSYCNGKIVAVNVLEKLLRGSNFMMESKILLYGFIFYLNHREDISSANFVRRIRIINNLARQTELKRNEMGTVLCEVESIIKKGEDFIRTSTLTPFNEYQFKEEKAKIEYLRSHESDAEMLFRLEDHILLEGQVGVVLWNKEQGEISVPEGKSLDECVRLFEALFGNIAEQGVLVSRALMKYGFYAQKDAGSKWRYLIGNENPDTWKTFFHGWHDGYEGADKIRENLRDLLGKLDSSEDISTQLESIISDFVEESRSSKRYTKGYYFAEYGQFFYSDNKYGKLYIDPETPEIYVLGTKHNTSSRTYNPFLYAACKSDDDWNSHLVWDSQFWLGIKGVSYIVPTGTDYEIRSLGTDKPVNPPLKLRIETDSKGIDKEDRVVQLRKFLYEKYWGNGEK